MPPAQLPLKDIHLPEAISWWPPATGWWIVAVLVILLIIFFSWLYRRLKRKTALKTAKKLLAKIQQDPVPDNLQKLREISALVRRVVISIWPRAEAAGLTGKAWLAFLDGGMTGAPFSLGIGQLLADAPYRDTAPTDAQILQLISLCEVWLKSCEKQKR
ncbi:conserved hypothetical protein [Candidatus Methylobacter favarea]|uniref:DUF4381 domain-containing protein n=1 Tax=Candidatus Methylobacter favarea TaxID=2707345 RepID=A0A8S0XFG0_9GAMM|nr:DUF4381 domain-containing protein [Candidatus Methylobacter favarea]CAA9890404.1 conserved hypothetical protein [Candidatus Methylobacter favarea]